MKKLILWLRSKLLGIDPRSELEILTDNGLKVGKNFNMMDGCSIDHSVSWLIEIGDDVTLAPRVMILAHDASSKKKNGYTLLGRVTIGNDVFVGANTTILPNVTIGDHVVIGAGSVVSRDIPSGSLAVGNPCRVVKSHDEYMAKKEAMMENRPYFDESWHEENITAEKKEKMKEMLSDGPGFTV